MKKKAIRNISITVLCIILAASVSGCGIFRFHIGRRPDPVIIEEPSVLPPPTGTSRMPEYYHYETDDFYADIEEMTGFYNEGSTEDAFKLYESLYNDLIEMDELQGVAYVKYSEDVNDEYYSEEYTYANETLVSASDAFFSACHEMVSGSHKEDFIDFLNDDVCVTYYQEYEPMNEEQLDLFSKENDLIQEYYSQADTLMDTSCTIDGITYTFEDVLGDSSDMFYFADPDTYMLVYETCLKKYNALVGETFLELVDVRDSIAKSYGYETYADYADDKIYEREYTVEDLEVMKEAVRSYSEELQAYQYSFNDDSVFSYSDSSQLVTKVGQIVSDISPVASETFDYLWNNQLYSIGDESGRMDGGYTIYFAKEQLPYIHIKTSGSASDAITFAHEFGHFTAFHAVPMPHPTISSGSLDLEETHSQGLQLLFTEKADSLFAQDADSIRAYNVMRVASAVIDGCIFDDWQREVYANPDMTLDEINDCFRRVEEEYGASYYTGLEYLWCDVSHNFESPMYYVSYAISAFGALQIWTISRDSYDQAVQAWESLILEGPYDEDYETVMKKAGLRSFAENRVVDDILSETTQYLGTAYRNLY